jgi:hypothetical protein
MIETPVSSSFALGFPEFFLLSLRGTKQSHYYLFGRDPKKGQAMRYNLFFTNNRFQKPVRSKKKRISTPILHAKNIELK